MRRAPYVQERVPGPGPGHGRLLGRSSSRALPIGCLSMYIVGQPQFSDSVVGPKLRFRVRLFAGDEQSELRFHGTKMQRLSLLCQLCGVSPFVHEKLLAARDTCARPAPD